MGDYIANPDLKAEKAVNSELGFARLLGDSSNMEVNIFYSDIKNLIVSKDVGGDMEQNQNIGKAFYKGIEVIAKTGFFTNNEIEMNYTYLDAQDRSPDRTSDYLEETAKHKLYLSDNYKINERFSAFGKFEYNSKRYEDYYGVWKTLDGFWTVDAKVMANITEKMSLELGSKNVFDKNYEFSYGYPREGRSFFLTLSGNI
jgi:iron complex outermembrane receptor protein